MVEEGTYGRVSLIRLPIISKMIKTISTRIFLKVHVDKHNLKNY